MKLLFNYLFPVAFILAICGKDVSGQKDIHPWEMQEIVFTAALDYANYYTDVTCWVDFEGPGFFERIYGFWDGGRTYKVRLVATRPGVWHWKSGSDQPDDQGINGFSGQFNVVPWSEQEKEVNSNRRGFVKPTPNGHALQYADGTPFFLVGDTWLAGSTWRLPFREAETPEKYIPGPGIGFEDAVAFRKKQGFNSVSMISCFPNWEADTHPATYADENGIYLRNAWEKFGYFTDDAQLTAKDMRDESGNLSFLLSEDHPGVADFNRIVPEYFQSLDKKIKHLSEQGFVPLLETVRRDACPSWNAYFNFKESYARFVQYLVSRYGAWNIIFSGIHLDWIPADYSLTADEFNEALTYHLMKYGKPPFTELYTTLINNSTYRQFGHAGACPWLTLHSVGNKPRDHRVSGALDTLFHLEPPYPAINFEPYYTGWDHVINRPGGERPPADSGRDNYFSRAQMYGSVLSGGLSGHVHGTAAYDITTTGEPKGFRPHIWEALNYRSGNYMQHLKKFVLSEGIKYRFLEPAAEDLHPRKAPGSPPTGLDGWSYMMRTPEKDFALLYFENLSVLPELRGFNPGTAYELSWFNPENGAWENRVVVACGEDGIIELPLFPGQKNPSVRDRAAKLVKAK